MHKTVVGFVLFPNLTQLDLTGPLQVLSRLPGAKVSIAAKTMAPVPSDCGLDLMPTTTFADAPQFDILCVPGGFGVAEAMLDTETVAFIRRQAEGAKYVTSVCTGAFLLGVAGLLQGRAATTHWGYTELLPSVGARHQKGRYVQDGNVITAGGVTSGIDFGLRLVAEMAGPDAAQAIQLAIEYDPDPPFASGHPDQAPEAAMALVAPRYERSRAVYRETLEAVAAGAAA